MNQWKRWMKEWVPTVAIAVIVSFTFNTYIAQGMMIPSGSMLPTIQLNDKVLVEKMVGLTDFKFGDIVVFYPPLPGHENERYIKRLIGLPGDTIEIKDGALYRNGQKVDEPYVKEPMNYTYGPVTVPANQYFFLGDNRNESLDSHMWPTPFVDKSKIVGKAMFRYYPFGSIGGLIKKMTDGRTTITIYGKVAYDVENAEWVMWVDDRFVPMEGLYAGINGELRRRGLPPLKVGDEISLEVKRSSGQEKGNAI